MSEMTPTRSTNRMECYFKISAHSGEEKHNEGAFQFYYNVSQLMLNAYTCTACLARSSHVIVLWRGYVLLWYELHILIISQILVCTHSDINEHLYDTSATVKQACKLCETNFVKCCRR